MKLRLTRIAAENIADIVEFISERDPAAALRVGRTIMESLRTVLDFPAIGRMQATEGVRKIVTRRYGYLVYYQVDLDADEIVVLSVKHPSQERQDLDA